MGMAMGLAVDRGNSADGLYPTWHGRRRGMGRLAAEDWEHVVDRDLLPLLGIVTHQQ